MHVTFSAQTYQQASDNFQTPSQHSFFSQKTVQTGLVPWLPPTLWERSTAERCLIHAETVSLFLRLQPSSANVEIVSLGPL